MKQKLIKTFLVYMPLILTTTYTHAHQYEKRTFDKHIIHVVTINPKEYDIQIVKSNDGAIGRETVPSMAKRSKASIAINAGFFDIGGNLDGKASGTLVINGKKYGLKNRIQPLLIIDTEKLSITEANPTHYPSTNHSMVSGIPCLIHNNHIKQDLHQKTSDFYKHNHARTAIGTKSDGTIVIIVAEHHYQKDLTSITMGEVQSLLKEKNDFLTEKYHHKNPGDLTLTELKETIKELHKTTHGVEGLTILELAKFMKDLGCQNAINLDGGGSSTLWIDDKVINQTIGDTDEGNGVETVRPVSDAIVFIKK